MDKNFRRYWNLLYWKFWFSQVGALLLCSGSLTIVSVGVLSYFSINWENEFAFALFIVSAAIVSVWSSIWSFSTFTLRKRMHQLYPELEYSLHLFFNNYESALSGIQKQRIIKRLPSILKVPLSEKWTRLIGIFVLSVGILYFGSKNFNEGLNSISIPKKIAKTTNLTANERKEFKKGEVKIIIDPPPYTALKTREWDKNFKIPEGSKVSFTVDGGVAEPFIIQQGKDTISFIKNGKEWSKHFWLNYATAFQIYFQQEDSILNDQLMVFEVLMDQKPIVTTNLNENRVVIDWEQLKETFEITLQMRDDYGLKEANVIATLSKGDGESVKFRELKWSMPDFNSGYRNQNIDYGLRIDTLGLDPGDELYFYFEVLDNKYPEAQTSKSEVYFIEVKDTVQQESVAFEGLALSTEPEFFKSQRQIIIDTEKLIKDQNKLSRNAFEDKSDEIGADQKILRLRYGIFLGEEYEVKGGMGEDAGEQNGHDDHDHDHEGEDHDHSGHNHADHEEIGAQPNDRNFSNDLYNSPELEAYVHAHDNSEIATFFDADVKQKLKEALANMWEAELYLRTYKPKMALPYEYRALELIKEVQRASRIYVERMGFEPPPLEPDKKRLTGNLKSIQPNTGTYNADSDQFWENLRSITTEMKLALEGSNMLVKQELISDLSDVLIKEMIKNPVRYAKLLTGINQFKQAGSNSAFQRIVLMLEQVLPAPEEELKGVKTNQLQLKSIFHQHLQSK